MARRGSGTTPDESTEAVTPEVNETEDTTTEAPAEVNETEGTEPEAKPEDKPIDLTAFREAALASLAEGDSTTGELPLAAVEPVNAQYRALDGAKPKRAATTWLEESMKSALMGPGAPKIDDESVPRYETPNMQHARSFVQLKDSMSAAKGGSKAASKPADPVAAYIERITGLQVAAQLVPVPEVEGDRDLAAEIAALVETTLPQAQALLAHQDSDAEDKGDAPEASATAKAAVKLASGKAAGRSGGGGNRSGVTHNLAKHFAEAFASVESGGFLSVAEIAKFDSEEYKDGDVQGHPSQGAVQARLFPESGKCTIEGVVPVDRTETTPRGARKA